MVQKAWVVSSQVETGGKPPPPTWWISPSPEQKTCTNSCNLQDSFWGEFSHLWFLHHFLWNQAYSSLYRTCPTLEGAAESGLWSLENYCVERSFHKSQAKGCQHHPGSLPLLWFCPYSIVGSPVLSRQPRLRAWRADDSCNSESMLSSLLWNISFGNKSYTLGSLSPWAPL